MTNDKGVRLITYNMSLRVQRSATFAQRLVEKQPQGFGDCFSTRRCTNTSYPAGTPRAVRNDN
ncbi:hypothetical protein [Nostoc sp.]|uniref:hypothetical protein n=1 Tax=Nostoc sp. TaxID=1180 RepID=UPI002FF51A07